MGRMARRTVEGRVGPVGAALVLGAALLLGGPESFAAKGGKPGSGRKGPRVSHTAPQEPPVRLGTSGGWALDLANGYCCGGTLGALVEIRGVPHVLSNWHVLANDTVPGSNGITSSPGDPVIQPGLVDVRCDPGRALVVALLAPSPALPGSNVDAAVAEAVAGMVDPDGAILEVGPPSTQTASAFPGQAVKKSGRTTRLTRSAVTDVDATVSVVYQNECAGQESFTKTFEGQILVRNRRGRFLAAGDSGSLLLEDVEAFPRAVGLLFAGSDYVAVANPMDEVLAALDATMIGVDAAEGPAPEEPLLEEVGRARGVKRRHAAELGNLPHAVGHAVGVDPAGRVVIKVLLERDGPGARAALPARIDGIPVVPEVVGTIVAY